MKTTMLKMAGAALLCLMASAASATQITFDDADGVYTNLVANGPSKYTSQGYSFTAITAAGDSDGAHFHQDYNMAGSVMVHDNTPEFADIYRLTSAAGLFNLTSFTTMTDGLLWSVNGGAMQASVAGLNVVNMNGVSKLDFRLANASGCCSDGLSNFEVSAATSVPEPTSIALLGLGLAAFAARRRKAV